MNVCAIGVWLAVSALSAYQPGSASLSVTPYYGRSIHRSHSDLGLRQFSARNRGVPAASALQAGVVRYLRHCCIAMALSVMLIFLGGSIFIVAVFRTLLAPPELAPSCNGGNRCHRGLPGWSSQTARSGLFSPSFSLLCVLSRNLLA